MAWGDASSPIRFGGGQVGSTNRELFLDVFGGEVITAFEMATVFGERHTKKTVGGGQKSWRFPKTWKATAEYHTPGQEMLGNDIDTSEITVTIDDILVAHTALSDIDTMLSHFDVRSEFSRQMGIALSLVYDKNVARQLVLAARTAADGPFPGGSTAITDSNLVAAPTTSAHTTAWFNAIKKVNENFYANDVPEYMPRYVVVPYAVFEALKYHRDSNGQYLVLNRDFQGSPGAGGIAGRAETMMIDGVTVIKSKNTPFGDNEAADTSVYAKYRADYSNTAAVAWTPQAVATVQMMDIGFESTRDTRRLEDFMVAKMLVGHGTLRPECAQELKTA